jgi:hypothetical protein
MVTSLGTDWAAAKDDQTMLVIKVDAATVEKIRVLRVSVMVLFGGSEK